MEALQAADWLAALGIEAEVVDVRTLSPLDTETLLKSIRKTGRLIALDTGWSFCGFSAELLAMAVEGAYSSLLAPPRRIALPDCPTPTSHALAQHYYPGTAEIFQAACELMGVSATTPEASGRSTQRDVPDKAFTGPF
ncbi:2-oxoisovalerate dehydrogenase subunit beta [compost metagenome]